jgi:hypothetical protein
VNLLIGGARLGALDPFANSGVTASRNKVAKMVKIRSVCK